MTVEEAEEPEEEVRLAWPASPAAGKVVLLPAAAAWSGVGGRRELPLLSIGSVGAGGGAQRHLDGEADRVGRARP